MSDLKKSYKKRFSTYDELITDYISKRTEFYESPSKVYCKPFRIFGNLYYIGDEKVCSYLVDTGDGLIIFDTGHPHTIHLLVQSIWELGFNPADIKYIIHTHGHFDHFGASNEFRTLYGCKTIMSRIDMEMIRDNPNGALLSFYPIPYVKLPIIDETFEDGDVIALGNTKVLCVLTPGHSPGNTSFFFDVQDDKKTCRVAYFGGAGFNCLRKVSLDANLFPYSLRDDFLNSIDKVKSEVANIVLGSHPSQYSLFEKIKLMEENSKINPFIDDGEWDRYLTELKIRFKDFLKFLNE